MPCSVLLFSSFAPASAVPCSETAATWDDMMTIVSNWYDYLDEQQGLQVPDLDASEVPEGDLEALMDAIHAWEDRIADLAGHSPFQGHGNHHVSASSQMGIGITVEEVE